MALHWNLENVENWKQLFKEEDEHGNSEMKSVHERILMHTMNVGIREINEKNWKKFYGRVYMWERVKGAGYYTRENDQLKPIYVTEDDVKRMIGLWTNASEFPKTKFLNYLSRGFEI